MNSDGLLFETDNSKFYDELEEITETLGNTKSFGTNIGNYTSNNYGLNFIDCTYVDTESECSEKGENIYLQIEYGQQIITFANRTELAEFINERVEYTDPYYIFIIPKKTYCVVVKMRNIESICEYLIKFHQN